MKTAVEQKREKKGMSGKDLMNIGIFTAIYFMIVLVCAMLGMVPVLVLLIGIIAPILAGVPITIFLTRVNHYGMILSVSVIMGLLMLLVGMGYYPLLTAVISGILAELIYRGGKDKTAGRIVLTYAVFSMWCWGNYILMFSNKEAYFATRQSFGQAYIDALTAMTPLWLLYALLPAVFASGLLGGVIGRKLTKKHFKKAGIVG